MNAILEWQAELEPQSAMDRIRWSLDKFSGQFIATSSFGIQSAVTLHLLSQLDRRMPIIFIDTGYLFQETYLYANRLRTQFELDLHCYCPRITPAHAEALYGRQWEDGLDGLESYLERCKLEPMKRALEAWKPKVWIAGLRRKQSESRMTRPVLEQVGNLFKLYPIIDWSDQQVEAYIEAHDLPRHPLEAEGFVSVGDWHSTTKLGTGMRAQDTRFGGIKRECGLHDNPNWKGGSDQ